MASKSKLASKCKEVIQSSKCDDIFSIDEISKEYETLFALEQVAINEIEPFETDCLDYLENCTLLEEVIIGNSNSQIGELIKRLGSADWVKTGIQYSKSTEGVCPFCQQPLSAHIQKEIEDFFDEDYKDKCEKLNFYFSKYNKFKDFVNEYRRKIPDNSAVNCDGPSDCLETLLFNVEQNIQIITKKVDSPSQSVKIRSIKCYVDDLCKEIDSVNAAIREHNKLISDDMAREKCCQKVWKFIVSEISPDLQFCLKELNSKDKGVNGLYNQVQGYKAKKEEYINQISQIQSQISSIVPTINAINRVLESFGFVGFMLRENMEKSGTYKIVRPDGTDVKETLSEGERNFVSFLYFYHLCLGSNSKEGINFKKIIVIDDPISSLDSNVMFIRPPRKLPKRCLTCLFSSGFAHFP